MHRIRRAYRTNQGHDYLLRAVDCLGSSTETRRNHVGKCATLSDTSCSSCTTRPNPKGSPELEHCSNSTQLIALRTVRARRFRFYGNSPEPKGFALAEGRGFEPRGRCRLTAFRERLLAVRSSLQPGMLGAWHAVIKGHAQGHGAARRMV